MSYNQIILPQVLKARAISLRQLSQRLKISADELRQQLEKQPQPAQSLLNAIAEELALPSFVFFMGAPPTLSDAMPDFRSPAGAPSAKSKETLKSLNFSRGIQRAAVEAKASKTQIPRLSVSELVAAALKSREFFGIDIEDQKSAKDARAFYNVCRKKIEDKGLFVLRDSFPQEDGSGYCLAHDVVPLVVVNTRRQGPSRQLFTLVHELAHALIGKTGISDPFERHNAIEVQCNKFAAEFLIPKTYVAALLGPLFPSRPLDPTPDDVASAARRLKVSHEATALRLEELGLYRPGSYKKWKQLVHNDNPDFNKPRGGNASGEPVPQEKVKLAKFGFRFASVFSRGIASGTISDLDLYRSSGLKPKYQNTYFDYARSLTSEELQSLGDGDD